MVAVLLLLLLYCLSHLHLTTCGPHSSPTGQVGAIIISPTRELAKQIQGVAEPFIQSVPGLSMQLLVGGT